jgi:hypothetical protein
MDFSIKTDHIEKSEKIGFAIAIVGVIILLALTVKSSVTAGTVPKIEQQIFSFIFLITLSITGGVLISHYTSFFTKIAKKVSR